MATIAASPPNPSAGPDVLSLPAEASAADLWPRFAEVVAGWLASRRLAPRDTLVLLPYAALLPLAREAFAARGGWQPRIETTQTLTESLGPEPDAELGGGISGDPVRDRLAAAALLRRQGWGRERERRDSAGFAHLAELLADAARSLLRTAHAMPPRARESFWSRLQESLPAVQGPNALESGLLGVAVEWAALTQAPASDRLFAEAPAAWVALRIGGADPLAESLLRCAGRAGLVVDADPDSTAEPFAALLAARPLAASRIRRLLCNDFESEASATVAVLVEQLNTGRRPVALISLDRQLIRRVRGQLLRQGVRVSDETGWRLSTTVAAAHLMALLRAAAPDAGPDACLAWLKTAPAAEGRWVDALEAHWRQARSVFGEAERASAQLRWQEVSAALKAWQEPARRSLAAWLSLLDERAAATTSLEGGEAVLRALRLGERDAAWVELAEQTMLTLPAFTTWVDQVLDAANLEPPRAADADVVITPLARALGRPFAHVVLPGADHLRLGPQAPAPGLISDGLAQRWQLDHEAQRQRRQQLALAHLLRAPGLTILRRRFDAAEPLAASPWVQWLVADAAARAPTPAEEEWRARQHAVGRRPQSAAVPVAPAEALPERLSASAIEALRDCPYRFYARSVLRLAETDELERETGKRDYGTWLHELLDHFHRQRAGASGDDGHDASRLQAAADHATRHLGLDMAELLPFQASFKALAPAYLAWLAAREAAGWRWVDGERAVQARPAVLHPQYLEGRLDRIDSQTSDGRQLAEVIDYKTGSAQRLQQKVRRPLEDTQLVFYAALLRAAEPGLDRIRAGYLALDDADAPKALLHDDVEAVIEPMLDGLADDFRALRAGAGMPALGEGPVCEFCEARGLCRRDHRPAPQEPDAEGVA